MKSVLFQRSLLTLAAVAAACGAVARAQPPLPTGNTIESRAENPRAAAASPYGQNVSLGTVSPAVTAPYAPSGLSNSSTRNMSGTAIPEGAGSVPGAAPQHDGSGVRDRSVGLLPVAPSFSNPAGVTIYPSPAARAAATVAPSAAAALRTPTGSIQGAGSMSVSPALSTAPNVAPSSAANVGPGGGPVTGVPAAGAASGPVTGVPAAGAASGPTTGVPAYTNGTAVDGTSLRGATNSRGTQQLPAASANPNASTGGASAAGS